MYSNLPDCDDWQFISEISNRFPSRDIMKRFREFVDMVPSRRPKMAAIRTNFVDREGWYDVGISPPVQSLRDHIDTMLDMLHHLSPADIDIPHLAAIIEIHDLQEAITSDFTWDDPISKAEKHRIEQMAINIIYENQPGKITLWNEYAAKRTTGALWVNDIDKLECIYEFEVVRSKTPGLQETFNHWSNDVRAVLKTDRGLQICNYLAATADAGIKLGDKHARIAETGRFLHITPT